MWNYEKRLQFPVQIKTCCPKTASLIISQFGGPDGELSASMRYLSQRYSMPCKKISGLLTDIGTEELAHMEIVCAMIYQLTKNMTTEDARAAGFDAYYVDHTSALYPPRRQASPLTPANSRARGTPSRISRRIWPQSKRPASPMKTSCASSPIPTCAPRSPSCAPGSSYTSSASEKPWSA